MWEEAEIPSVFSWMTLSPLRKNSEKTHLFKMLLFFSLYNLGISELLYWYIINGKYRRNCTCTSLTWPHWPCWFQKVRVSKAKWRQSVVHGAAVNFSSCLVPFRSPCVLNSAGDPFPVPAHFSSNQHSIYTQRDLRRATYCSVFRQIPLQTETNAVLWISGVEVVNVLPCKKF